MKIQMPIDAIETKADFILENVAMKWIWGSEQKQTRVNIAFRHQNHSILMFTFRVQITQNVFGMGKSERE